MDPLEFWILLLATIFFNLIWPPIVLTIELVVAHRQSKRLLRQAVAIRKEVHKFIEDMKQADYMLEGLSNLLKGFKTQTEKSVETKIEEEKEKIKRELQKGGGGSRGPDVGDLITAGLTTLVAGGQG